MFFIGQFLFKVYSDSIVPIILMCHIVGKCFLVFF